VRNQNIQLNWETQQGKQPALIPISGVFYQSQSDVRYVLTASLTEQRIESSLVLSGNLTITGSISAKGQHLIFSSSAGSVVALSSSAYGERWMVVQFGTISIKSQIFYRVRLCVPSLPL